MKKTILVAVALAMLALASPAPAAHGGKRAITYKAKLAPSAESSVRGKATLVDGKRRDKVRLRVKGLEAGATYTWSLRRAAGGGDACTGEAVDAFGYASFEGRRKGGAKGRARSTGFASGDGAYAVVVTDAGGADVACFELKTKAQRKAERKQRSSSDDEVVDGEDEILEYDEADELAEESGDDDGEDVGEDESGDDEPAGDEPGDDAEDEL